jgi:hypothetical protein
MEKELRKMLPEASVEFVEQTKNNGLKLKGVLIKKQDEKAAPIIYIDSFIEAIEKQEITEEEAARRVVEIYNKSGLNIPEINKDFILDNVKIVIVNKEKNSDLLQEIPHKDFLNLAIIYRVFTKINEDSMSFIVKNEILEALKISFEDFDIQAHKNTKDFNIRNMNEIISEKFGMDIGDDCPLWVLSNKDNYYGASIITQKNELRKLAEKLEDDLYILPSSVHEVIAIPKSFADNVEMLQTMVKEVNGEQVAEDEQLSDTVYIYNKQTDTIQIA